MCPHTLYLHAAELVSAYYLCVLILYYAAELVSAYYTSVLILYTPTKYYSYIIYYFIYYM
jgi:hypothetical protein